MIDSVRESPDQEMNDMMNDVANDVVTDEVTDGVTDMTSEPVMEQVTSRDGTPIALWRSGTGRPLVLVHGTAADHSRWNTVRGLLEPHATIYAMDRRGRGGSGDADGYTIEREYEDVAEVVDTLAEQWDGAVDVLGHSYGGLCALAAAQMTPNVRRLALYESPVLATDVYPPDFGERLAALLAEGRREDVLVMFFREVVRMPDDQLAAFRLLPAWSARLAVAHTLVREQQAIAGFQFDAASATMTNVPTLLLAGSDSPEFLRASTKALADTLPNPRVEVLEGQQHAAMDTAPQLFADAIANFFWR